MKFGNIHPDENGDKEFTVKCLVKNYEVFDSKIKVVVSKDKKEAILGYYNSLQKNSKYIIPRRFCWCNISI